MTATNTVERAQIEQELRDLQKRLERFQESHPVGSKGFTKVGIRKMVARLHVELALDVSLGRASTIAVQPGCRPASRRSVQVPDCCEQNVIPISAGQAQWKPTLA